MNRKKWKIKFKTPSSLSVHKKLFMNRKTICTGLVLFPRTTWTTRDLARTYPLWRMKWRSTTSSTARWRLWLLISLPAETRYAVKIVKNWTKILFEHTGEHCVPLEKVGCLNLMYCSWYYRCAICKIFTFTGICLFQEYVSGLQMSYNKLLVKKKYIYRIYIYNSDRW